MSENHSKNCLVTGASGFIGRQVVQELIRQDWQVTSVSRNTNSDPTYDNLENVKLDLHNPANVAAFFEVYRPTYLVHLAWEATPGKFWQSTENFPWISSSAHLIDQFVKNGGVKAVLAGSCAEYKWENKILHEDTSPTEADSYYAASKLAFKSLADVIGRDINIVWARLFFPYGPDEAGSKLISYIFKEISEDKLPTIQTPDRAVDFIHVDDVAIIIEKLLSGLASGTVNICSGTPLLPYEIAIRCAEVLGKPELKETLSDLLSGLQSKAVVYGSNEKRQALTGMPSVRSLEHGLQDYVESN